MLSASIIIRVFIINELSVYGDKLKDCSKVVVVGAGKLGPLRGRREPICFTQAINSEGLDWTFGHRVAGALEGRRLVGWFAGVGWAG